MYTKINTNVKCQTFFHNDLFLQELVANRGEADEKENEWLGKLPKHLIRSKATLV
jgi:hypothetical protein